MGVAEGRVGEEQLLLLPDPACDPFGPFFVQNLLGPGRRGTRLLA